MPLVCSCLEVSNYLFLAMFGMTEMTCFGGLVNKNPARVKFTLWLFNIAMENGPFIDGLPNLNIVIFHGCVK